MQKIEASQDRIDTASQKLDGKEEEIREKAREAGRKEATKAIKKIDTIFSPMKLNPDDSKVLFHPVDYIVFNGMKVGQMKNLILLDKNKISTNEKRLQRSIEKVIEKENYDWITLRIDNIGRTKQE